MMPSEKREKILEFLRTTEDKNILKYKRDLTLNVPYRLQVPFYEDIDIDRKTWYGPKASLTSLINQQKRLMYYFILIQGLDTVIEVDPLWSSYLDKHKEILFGWTKLKLIQYLQNRIPSVPGIADKIEVPVARDIERVRKYWKLIIKLDPSLHDIYGDVDLSNAHKVAKLWIGRQKSTPLAQSFCTQWDVLLCSPFFPVLHWNR